MSRILEGVGRLFKVVFGFLAVVVLTAVLAVGALYYHFAKDLPKLTGIDDYKPLQVSEVFADDNTKIGEFWQECRYVLPYDKIPRRVVDAFVASEDERFWEHKGVDVKGILRAFFENLKAGRTVQGASTITQQVTRALLLTRERSFGRKIREALLATEIEKNLSKEQILAIYLNQIFLGNRAHGVQAAARNYFHKDITELNLAETSMIAGLPSAPAAFSPLANAPAARIRQQHVLARMLDNGYISQAEYEDALRTPLTLYRAGIDKDVNDQYAPYFVEHVRRYVEQTYGQQALYAAGLKIYTTVNLEAYRAADRAVKRGLLEVERRKGFHGPVEAVEKGKEMEFAEAVHRQLTEWNTPITLPAEPETQPVQTPIEPYHIYKGVITAMDEKGVATVQVGHTQGIIEPSARSWIGRTPKVDEIYWVRQLGNGDDRKFAIEVEPKLESALFSANPLTGEVKAMIGGFSFKKSEFNRATQAVRQPGSSFKPIVYAAALDKGYTPKTTVVDAYVEYKIGRRTYSPENYGRKFSGPMSVRDALCHSVNVVAVKVFHDIGIDYTVAFARKLGLVSPIARYLSTALGSSDVSLQEVVRAYSTFPSGGVRPNFIYVRKIVDKDGHVLEENHPTALDPEHVFDTAASPRANEGYNRELLAEGEKAIAQDDLKITDVEKRILYGGAIPPGHVITPRTAYLMVSLMRDVVDHGTGVKARELKRPAAGKTGTTNDESDAWFVAYVPDMVTGVWMGYDSRKKIGPGMTGGVVSAPIWVYYMQEALKDEPVLDFAKPTDVKVADINSWTGGSALEEASPKPEDLEVPTGEAPASRGVDFLYKDLNNL
ncbi:MAG TPA: PBP1A family penicillin-binding protein [bacterium]|nr:PBP1A family penicillin-binding protein [bacterium]